MTREVKLGLFVLITAVSFAFLVLTFGEIPILGKDTKSYTASFEDVGGLSVGAEVRVAGVRSGRVKDLFLEDGRVRVVFEVDREVKIYRDARAYIGTLGLMGDRYLGIIPGTPVAGELEEGEEVKATEAVADTDRLVRELTRTAEGFREVAESLREVLEENRRSLREVLNNLRDLTEVLKEVTEENRENLRRLIDQMAQLTENLNRTLPETLASVERLADRISGIADENREDIRRIVANLRDMSEDLPRLVENLNTLSENLAVVVEENREDIRRSVRNLAGITERLRESSRRIDRILAKIERGEGTIGKLVHDEELYRSVTKGARLFGEAGEVITNTSLYLGFGGEAYSGGDSKGYVSLRIQPERSTYYLLEIVGDSRGRVYTEQIVGGQEIVKKEFKPEFTLQIAKNFFLWGERYITLRAGLKESTGGVGLDFVPSPRMRIYTDVWDVGRKDRPGEENLKPLLQIGLQLRLRGPFYTRFGGDDLLNDRLRGVFIGAGLEFSEDNLKYLLGGLGLPLP
ncbi:MAG: MlaD family protein [Aquificota bacterium]|nr:MlaD family protein [Aquificota bacterium]